MMCAVGIGLFVLFASMAVSLYTALQSLNASRQAAEAEHASTIRLVRLALELQSELDAQEDHDRWTLQLYLRLEREHLPKLHRAVSSATGKGCSAASQTAATEALGDFEEEAHRHSHAMLDALQRQGSRARKRAHELASSILVQAKVDRERLRTSGGTGWSDADLEGPLVALWHRLRRPNATFELSLDDLGEWEAASADALREGGAPDASTVAKMQHLVAAAALPQNDQTRAAMFTSEDPTPSFVSLLQRARLHRHLPQLLDALREWHEHRRSVWDVVELVETLRAQHVFPMSLLRLAEHEWDQMVEGATGAAGRAPQSFDADQ
jgi:hypothetical protein